MLGHSKVRLLGIFIAALAVSLMVFIAINRYEHGEITNQDYVVCVATQQIAKNQQRVLAALIRLEPNVFDKTILRRTLLKVPVINCK